MSNPETSVWWRWASAITAATLVVSLNVGAGDWARTARVNLPNTDMANLVAPGGNAGRQMAAAGASASGQVAAANSGFGPVVSQANAFARVNSFAEAAALVPAPDKSKIRFQVENEILPKARVGAQRYTPDGALQANRPGEVVNAMPAALANFEGGFSEQNIPILGGQVYPPDTNGDIGYDPVTGKRYYFQWLNSFYRVWDVSNPVAPIEVISATAGNALWQTLPGTPRCKLDNDGDPIVLFDEQAGRWLITQFAINGAGAGPYSQCVAVSQTGDPTGSWFVYDFSYGAKLNDYPKFGVWPDPTYNAYYMTVNQFTPPGFAWGGAGVVAYNRAKILAGDPSAEQVKFDLFTVNSNFGGMLPADLDGMMPPAGTPGIFIEVDDSSFGFPSDQIAIWEFRPNWATPASSTFGIGGQPNYTLTVAAFNLLPCTTGGSRACIPQQASTVKLDAIGDRAMHRAAFRNFGTHQSLVFNHTVWADATDRAGVRWYELRRDPGTGTWAIHQQSTYAPADGLYRWMASASMDYVGNTALLFSASSAAQNPSINYAGRLASDPLNTMLQGEAALIVGGGAQTGTGNRWGDYSMIGTDPQDQCTFWMTSEYYDVTDVTGWNTRIGSFRFPSCSLAPGFTISPAPPTQTICQSTNANYTVDVFSAGGFSSPVTLTSVGHPGTANFVPNPVTPPADGVTNTVLTISGAPAGNYTFNITGTSGVSTSTAALGLNVVGGIAGVPTLSAPADGAVDVPVMVPLAWTASSGAASYYLEIATDAGFSTIVYSATVAGTTHTTPGLTPNTTFFWRVRAANVCGTSAFSTPSSFTTANLVYATYCAAPNQAIADNTTATTTLNIPSGGTLVDVDLIITATHTWVGDLQFTLGNGINSAMVIDRPGYTGSGFGCSANDVGARLDDEGVSGPVESQCASTPPALFGNPTPNNPLGVFDGQALAGTWTLAVRDNVGGDTGTLQSWCVAATLAGTSGPNPQITVEKTVGTDPGVCAASDSLSVPYGSDVTYCYKVINTGNISLTTHDLVDDQLGTLLNGFPYTLTPLSSVFITQTATLTATTVNSATWTASVMTYTASASDVATVTVVATPTISVAPAAFNVSMLTNASTARPLTITNMGLGSTLNWAITETPGLPSLSGLPVRGSTATDRAQAKNAPATITAPRNTGRPAAVLAPVPSLSEGFEDINTLGPAGWYTQNNSSPVGLTGWFQGNDTVFPAQAGSTTSYIGANFNNTSGAGNISNWLLTPELNLVNGATFTFWTRKPTPDTFPDRLQVRLSTNGASTNVGSTDASVGDFTTVLLEINPTLVTGVYPTAWTQFSVTISGLGAPTTGRIAFRYWVTNGGPTGANSDYIGIDTLAYSAPMAGCAAPSDVPWLSVAQPSGSTPYGTPTVNSLQFNSTGLPVGTYTATVCINSNAPATPLVQVPVTLTVIEQADFGVQVTPLNSTAQAANPGATVTYTLLVSNTGLFTDTYAMTATAGAFATFSPNALAPIGPGQATTVDVTVTVPLTASAGQFDVADVVCRSDGDPAQSAQVSLTTTANQVAGVGASAPIAAQTGSQSGLIVYAVTVTNTGNATDSFTVTVSGNAFTTTAPASVGPLAAGEATTFNVTVTVPANAPGGTVDTATLTFTSQFNPASSTTRTLTTTAAMRMLYLPIIRR